MTKSIPIWLNMLISQEERLADIEAKLSSHSDQLQRIAHKKNKLKGKPKLFTVPCYFSMQGIDLTLTEIQKINKQCELLSKERGIPVSRVKDRRFGAVNAYHEPLLKEVLESLL